MPTCRRRAVLSSVAAACAIALLCAAPSRAEEPRGYLGLALAAADPPPLPETAEGGFEVAGEVAYLVPGATAARAGLELGDLILALDGRRFTRGEGGPAAQLREMLKGRRRGERVGLLVVRRSVSRSVVLDGEAVADPDALIEDLPLSLGRLEDGQALVLEASRTPRLEKLELVLGPHPHDVPRSRPALDDETAFAQLLGPPSDLERFGAVAVERFGLGEDTADLRERLRRLHDSDDPFRLDLVGFVHRHPWRIEEAARDLLGRLAPEGGEAALGGRLRAAAALQRADLAALRFEPLPRGVSAEAHAQALEGVLTETAGLVGRAFERVSEEEEGHLVRSWPDLAAALREGIYLHADESPARRRRNLETLRIAAKVDLGLLHAAALSWSRLAEPAWVRALARDLAADPRADEPVVLERETPFGAVVIGGRGRNVWRDRQPAILIDLGGDDVHQNAAGASHGAERPACAVLDLAGDDAWETTADAAQGVGLLGVGLLIDVAGDDRYLGLDWAQGAGLLGVGVLIDGGGNDRYRARHLAQGAGAWGAGLLIDLGGDDLFEARAHAQGLGLPGAVGVLHDAGGDDRYWAKGGSPTGYGTAGVFDAWSQGCGLGLRWLQSGGVGALVDDGGADDREAGNFAQGGGYYFGWGLLHDRGRSDDVHVGSRYDQGFAAHQALGTFLDDGGDDRYRTRNGVIAGLAWDECVTLFRDGGGRDDYQGGFFSLGASAHNSFCFFVDEGGADRYSGAEPGRAGGNDYHGGTSLSLFLDLGSGRDAYERGLTPGEVRVRPEHAIVADVPTRLFRRAEGEELEAWRRTP
jgi:hypothetical protein